MDFAREVMKKYGWSEGEGLGKNKSGINQPVKANFKFDTTGFGLDKATEFNNHWWQRVFNDAANNIKITNDDGGVSVKLKNKDSIEISTKDYSVEQIKSGKEKSGYNFFLKTSILTNQGYEIEDSNADKIKENDKKSHSTLTDEELFAACNGRTAHKGARHGLNLTGKLNRIKEQDKKLLQAISKNSTTENMDTDESDWTVVKKKRNKKKNENKIQIDYEDVKVEKIREIIDDTDYVSKSKKKKRKQKQLDENLSTSLALWEMKNDFISEIKSKKQKEDLGVSKKSKLISKKNKKKKSSQNSCVHNLADNIEPNNATENNSNIKILTKINSSSIEDGDEITAIGHKDKTKKGKVKKIKCKDKIVAKQFKKTLKALNNLHGFLDID